VSGWLISFLRHSIPAPLLQSNLVAGRCSLRIPHRIRHGCAGHGTLKVPARPQAPDRACVEAAEKRCSDSKIGTQLFAGRPSSEHARRCRRDRIGFRARVSRSLSHGVVIDPIESAHRSPSGQVPPDLAACWAHKGFRVQRSDSLPITHILGCASTRETKLFFSRTALSSSAFE